MCFGKAILTLQQLPDGEGVKGEMEAERPEIQGEVAADEGE